MANNAHHKNSWKDELWNVSLLPIIEVSQSAPPPHGPNEPAPSGGTALKTAALLSQSQDARRASLAEAA
jgi:hypothetical protein